jgi:hypothetical protein
MLAYASYFAEPFAEPGVTNPLTWTPSSGVNSGYVYLDEGFQYWENVPDSSMTFVRLSINMAGSSSPTAGDGSSSMEGLLLVNTGEGEIVGTLDWATFVTPNNGTSIPLPSEVAMNVTVSTMVDSDSLPDNWPMSFYSDIVGIDSGVTIALSLMTWSKP